MCDHVWIFEARTLSTQPVRRPCGMCGVYRMEPRSREPGIQTPWRARSGETLRACPACRAWGRARTCPASRRKLVDLESRGVSQRGAIQIHPLIRLACDSWQRRDQQLSIRRGSVRSSVLVWNAAARSRIGATAGGYREATKFCQPSCQRKAAKNAGGLVR